MFGHNDNQPTAGNNQQDDNLLNAAMPDPISGGAPDTPASTDSGMTFPSSAPSVPADNGGSLPSSPAPGFLADQPETPVTGSGSPGDDLTDLKQQALQHLSPLVSHLDQTPEEKFRTTMMMIQASDDQSLLKDALESAKAITDDKARAQALLDVINEINYFTQHQASK